MTKRSKIPAKILALILAVCMLASTVTPALAGVVRNGSTKYPDGLVVDGSTGWNSGGGDQYLLTGNFDVTVTFENTPFLRSDYDKEDGLTIPRNWCNFVFEIFGGANTKGVTFRADDWAWTYGTEALEPTITMHNITWEWDNFMEMCRTNPIVTLNVKKTNNTTVTATIDFYPNVGSSTSSAREIYTVTYASGVPSSMYLQVGADGGKVKILECRYNTAVLNKDDLTVQGGIGTASTEMDAVQGNFSIVYTFHNTSLDAAAVWNNFVVEVWGTGFGYTARADAFGWEYNGLEQVEGGAGMTWNVNNWNFEEFKADISDSDVTVTVERIDKVITLTYDIAANGHSYHIVGKTKELSLPDVLYVHLTGEKAKLTKIKAAIYAIDTVDDEEYDPSTDTDIIYGAVSDRVTVHDPSIIKDGNTYYIFGSHMAWAKSTDLIHWQPFTNNINRNYSKLFKTDAVWSAHGTNGIYDVSGNLWAPDVIYNKAMGKWCMYMSVNGDNYYSSIVLLTADNIEGPYTRVGDPIVYSGFEDSTVGETDFQKVTGSSKVDSKYTEKLNGRRKYGLNAIDPCVTYDEKGDLWMTYGSWFGGIYMLKLDKNTGLRDYSFEYKDTNTALAGKEYDVYQGIKIAGGYTNSGEASYLEKIGNYWFLFLSYGGFVANGGYNMRVFRSADITGPYVDASGESAIYSQNPPNNNDGANINGTVGNRLMTYYQWTHMSKGQVAQGHNSAFVDTDGRAYVVYHTRFNDGTEGHQVRVHQLFVNEDGWIVAAPFEYAGEKLGKAFTDNEVAGAYEVLFHTSTNNAKLECVKGQTLVFGTDHTLSGALQGTWAWSSAKGSPYVTLTAGSTTYKGVFLEQKIEEKDEKAICFTVLGSDEISVWGYQYPYSNEDFIDMAAEALASELPIGTFGQNLTLPAKGLFDVSVTWKSGNTAVITNDGKVTVPATDTTVTLTAAMTYGSTTKNVEFPVKVFASKQGATEAYLLWEYFTGETKDLSKAEKGDIRYRSPFSRSNVLGISIYNGVTIEFEVTPNAAVESPLFSNIISFRDDAYIGLWFTGGSYLGYNTNEHPTAAGVFDANLHNDDYGDKAWTLGTDFLNTAKKEKVTVKIDLLPNGFNVYFNGTLGYTQADIGTEKVPGGTNITNYSKVLTYLNGTATDLNFGWGSWWDGGFDGTISNVKLYVNPVDYVDTSKYVYYEDYNSTGDTGWTSPNAQQNLSIKNVGDKHVGYVDFAADTSASGNRGAYTNFPAEANLSGAYSVEADIKMTPGNVADRSVSQFAITGTDAKYGSNGTSYNDGIVSGYILKLSTKTANSNVYYINDGDQSVTIPANTWVHVKATVNGTAVTAEITIGEETKTFTATVNGTGTLKGLYLLRGRGNGTAAVDNIAVTKLVDFSALRSAIEAAAAEDTNKGNYTAASWEALEKAVQEGNELLKFDLAPEPTPETEEVTQELVDKAAEAIRAAIKGLVDITVLRAAVNAAPAESEKDKYTEASWTALQNAVAAGKALYQSGSKEEVKAAADKIIAAYNALVNVSALRDILKEAEAKAEDLESYSASSREALSGVIAEIKSKNLFENATQAEVDKAVEDIRAAIDKLIPVYELIITYDTYEVVAVWDYDWWAYVIDLKEIPAGRLDGAKIHVVVNDNDFDGKHWFETGAVYGRFVINVAPDKNEPTVYAFYDLVILVNGALPVDPDAVTVTGVTVDGVAAKQDDEGNWSVELPFGSTYPGPDSERIVVKLNDPAGQGIKAAISAGGSEGTYTITVGDRAYTLTVRIAAANYADLFAALAEVEALDEDDYTASSWAALQKAIAAADAGFTTQTAIDAAAKAIKAAITALVDVTALKDIIAEAEAKNEASYTAESWAALQTAVAAGKALIENGGTAEEVAAAVKTIRDAIAALRTPTAPTPPPPPSRPSDTTSDNVTTGSSDDGSDATETTATPSATVTGDSASSSVSSSMGNEIVRQAETNKSDSVVIEPDMPDTVTSAEVTIPGSTLTRIGERTDADVTVKTPAGNVTIPNGALEELGSAGGSVTVKVTAKDSDTARVDITAGGKRVETVDGGLKAALPLGNGQVAVLVDENGKETVIQKSLVKDGTAYVLLDGSATVRIVDRSKNFDDVSDSYRYADAVTFVSSHKLFKGTNGSTFAPEENMTRAMLVTVLWRLESEANAGEGGISFNDAANGTWYTDAVAWASAAGIAKGTGGNSFSPNGSITREQLATMLYRYARAAGMDTSDRTGLSGYKDGADVHSWSKDAMEWAVASGLIKGKGSGTLDAGGDATRIEVAIILQRLVGLMVK